MLGQAVCAAVVHARHSLVANQVDITRVVPADIRAEVVINCAGLVKQRQVSDSRFVLVNGYGPRRLAEACDVVQARLIHISTDCVFVGTGPHDENSVPDAGDIYAVSKRAGEVMRSPHLTVRTSFVGHGPRGLIHQLATQPEVRASRRLLWSGHAVETVAQLVVRLAERTELAGLLHIPGEHLSRFDLVTILQQTYGLRTRLIEDNSFIADRRLSSFRWEGLGLPQLPPFVEQIGIGVHT